ncbi:hypothetical protein [Novosphingobium capsulatum]|uniref:hypothetical protein n=1 Tax=Novosphingobium capsulatum TaxID=13688 RepID=UPI00078902A1|nr:hypothetical protein [Novosphingobium capsulatum]WQD94142.1 hypothetical protein U0041_06035 [Novosphingobium capsulatum]
MMYFEHAAVALALQLLIRRCGGSWWLGAAIASAYFIGREVAQAEYRWIEMFGQGRRANMPWWGPLDLRVWPKLDQWIDWIGPLVATNGLALIMQLWPRWR